MSEQPPVREGDVLSGKFKVERVLGQGGMGVVVAARHLQLDQLVALKFMLPAALGNKEAVERFLREARAVAKLRSEHITRVLDVGTLDNGAPYIVMELLEGSDIAGLLQRGPLPVGQAVGIILHVCAAVAEAHAIGVIHRDLKPRNLFLTQDVEGKPLVKVLDFGISKDLGDVDANSGSNSLTGTRMMLGSPHYMSPEQLKSSRSVDARADIWSLGVCLYELLTGKPPFDAASMAELCVIVLSEKTPAMPNPRGDIPRELEAIVRHCLEKQPADRFRSVADLATALEPYADPWAKAGAERARNVMRNSRQTGSNVIGVPSISPSGATLATSPTVATWDVADPRSRRRALPFVALGLVVAIAVGGVGFVVVSHHGQAVSAVPVVSVGGAPGTSIAAQPTTAVSATGTASTRPSATPVTSASPVTTTTVAARPTATQAATRTKPSTSAKPTGEDHLLQDRN